MSTFKLDPLTGQMVFVPSSSVLQTSVRYIDFLDGSDSTGDGSINFPWKTLQHAYDSVTDVSINRPYVFKISGGNNDTDTTTITGKPNISIISDYSIQISQPLTISSGSTNDGVTFTNIIFIGALTWIRNDFSDMGVTLINCEFFSGPILKQQGTGALSIIAINSVFVNMDLLAPNFGSFFYECTFLGSTTFGDVSSAAYYEIMGGYTSSNMSVSGGPQIYFSGLMVDEPFGASLTLVGTANGTPLVQTDSASVPKSITGLGSIILTAFAKYTNYTPSDPTKWANPQPTTVQQALDRIAAVVGNIVPIP